MFKQSCAWGLVFCAASVANASYTIGVILPPAPAPGGYNPGTVVRARIALFGLAEPDISARLIAFDFSASDPALGLADWTWWPAWENGQGFCAMNPATCGIQHAQFNNLPQVTAVYMGLGDDVLGQVRLPGDHGIVLGTLDVTLPDEPGIYRLDAVNPPATDTDHGARIDFGFENPTMLHRVFSGGSFDIIVVPEPATLLFLGAGGLALLRRRKMATCRRTPN